MMLLRNFSIFYCRYADVNFIKPCLFSRISRKFYDSKSGPLDKSHSEMLAKNAFLEHFNKDLIFRLRQNGYTYIIDSQEAESIAHYLTAGWNGHILEANPGPAILTKAILKQSDCHLRVFEKNKEFLTALEILSSEHPNLEIVQEDSMLLPSLDARTVGDHEEYEKFFEGLPKHSWDNGICFRFFSIISSKRSIKFLRYLLAALPNRDSIFANGRCELFLLLCETEYMYMKAEPKENFSTYRWSTVLYTLFFEISCLKKYSSQSLFPSPSYSRKSKLQYGQPFYLVKLIPKADLFSSVVSANKLPDLYFFVRHHLVKRTALVIPTMEGWIPLCGPRLIKEGMNVFTKFGDLSPKQILLLFNQFSSWPEYEDSTFHAALQRFHGRDPFNFEDSDK